MFINKRFLALITFIALGGPLIAQSDRALIENADKLYPTKPVVSHYHNNWSRNHYAGRIEAFMKEPLNHGEIVFLGNSITEQGGDWSKKFGVKNIRNRGISGDVTDGVLKRLDEIVYFKPKAVFILIGVNDVFNIHHEKDTVLIYDKIVPSTDFIGENILKIASIIQKKSPQTKIFVRTILPTNRSFCREDILAVNRLIKKNESKGVYRVIDLYPEFVDSEGGMRDEFTTDGVHLSEEGYTQWVQFEKPIIAQLAKTIIKQ